MSIDEIKRQLRRRAIVMEIGGFRPSDDPHASWFGRVQVARTDEIWPESGGTPMIPLCQINLTELPFRPARIDDISMITVFVDPKQLPDQEPNGNQWCLRAYGQMSELQPLPQPDIPSPVKPFPMRPLVIEEDYPCWEDVPMKLPAELDDKYHDLFKNVDGFKLGGWPTLVQSEIFWAPWNKHPIEPEYVFQIDTCAKANWTWGDRGLGYFGRGTASGHTDEWALAWQCL